MNAYDFGSKLCFLLRPRSMPQFFLAAFQKRFQGLKKINNESPEVSSRPRSAATLGLEIHMGSHQALQPAFKIAEPHQSFFSSRKCVRYTVDKRHNSSQCKQSVDWHVLVKVVHVAEPDRATIVPLALLAGLFVALLVWRAGVNADLSVSAGLRAWGWESTAGNLGFAEFELR